MINLRMEYSAPVDERMNVSRLLEDLHQVLLDDERLQRMRIPVKSSAVRIHQWFIGEQLDSVDFIQLILEIPQNDAAEIGQSVSGMLADVLEQEAEKVENLSVYLRIAEQTCIRSRS
ncbi:tautomerase family protein [Vibrio mangrovi]|uniref:5-carboxymethyl-2-hydroxymuconate isomerase n=1 Tax=Vibrio mangrovi TaxID=474394 RepID=A0A1Y6J1B1_9VIBR|nr:hypothetical protein [Vibrio mangrovi]MDW6002709.1 5-carboxymethyl-2-hydroxymuconate isomerase [Vibrio mangrovi]SMS02870.1 hypothetical protein VIM7927_04212 [Vibrio mangrovi]